MRGAVATDRKKTAEELSLKELLAKLEQMTPEELRNDIAATTEILRTQGLKQT